MRIMIEMRSILDSINRTKMWIKRNIFQYHHRGTSNLIKRRSRVSYNKIHDKTVLRIGDAVKSLFGTKRVRRRHNKVSAKKNLYGKSVFHKRYKVKSSEDVITHKDIKEFERNLGIDTSPIYTPIILIGVSIICFSSMIIILMIIGLLLMVIGIVFLCRGKYKTAHMYRQASIKYFEGDYDMCKKYLNKLSKKEKVKECYKKFTSIIDKKNNL